MTDIARALRCYFDLRSSGDVFPERIEEAAVYLREQCDRAEPGEIFPALRAFVDTLMAHKPALVVPWALTPNRRLDWLRDTRERELEDMRQATRDGEAIDDLLGDLPRDAADEDEDDDEPEP